MPQDSSKPLRKPGRGGRPARTREQILALVQFGQPDECFPWLGARSKTGYGRCHWNGHESNAHRVVYQLLVGPIPDGLKACHSCDSRYPAGDPSYRICCNPAHIFLDTDTGNMADRNTKGRQAVGERTGPRRHPERYPRGETHYTHLHPERRPRGERNHQAKLSAAQVQQIRSQYEDGNITQLALAKQFGISESSVHNIVTGQSWQHLS